MPDIEGVFRHAGFDAARMWMHACGVVRSWDVTLDPSATGSRYGCGACGLSPGEWVRLYVRADEAP